MCWDVLSPEVIGFYYYQDNIIDVGEVGEEVLSVRAYAQCYLALAINIRYFYLLIIKYFVFMLSIMWNVQFLFSIMIKVGSMCIWSCLEPSSLNKKLCIHTFYYWIHDNVFFIYLLYLNMNCWLIVEDTPLQALIVSPNPFSSYLLQCLGIGENWNVLYALSAMTSTKKLILSFRWGHLHQIFHQKITETNLLFSVFIQKKALVDSRYDLQTSMCENSVCILKIWLVCLCL